MMHGPINIRFALEECFSRHVMSCLRGVYDYRPLILTMINIPILLPSPVTLRPNAGHGLLILKVSRSQRHTTFSMTHVVE